MRRKEPRSRVIAAAALLVCLSPQTGSAADAVGEEDCHRDRVLMQEGIAAARRDGVTKIDAAIAEAGSDAERASLIVEREALWDQEERYLVFADVTWRDCLAYVRRQRAARTQ